MNSSRETFGEDQFVEAAVFWGEDEGKPEGWHYRFLYRDGDKKVERVGLLSEVLPDVDPLDEDQDQDELVEMAEAVCHATVPEGMLTGLLAR